MNRLICRVNKPNINYFTLFDIPVKYTVDIKNLEFKYKEFQNHIHPDKFQNSSIKEKENSEYMSRHINEAYYILKNDKKRAEYILNIKGVNDLSSDVCLEHVFELNEKIENNEITEEYITSKIKEIKLSLATSLDQDDFKNAKKYYSLLSYYENIEKKVI